MSYQDLLKGCISIPMEQERTVALESRTCRYFAASSLYLFVLKKSVGEGFILIFFLSVL